MALSELLPSRKRTYSSIDPHHHHHHHTLPPPPKLHISSFLDDLDFPLPLPLESSPAHDLRLAEIMESLQRAMEPSRSSDETPICVAPAPLLPADVDCGGLDDADGIYEILFAGEGLEKTEGLARPSEEEQGTKLLETLMSSVEAPTFASDGSAPSSEDADDLRCFLAQLSADSSSELLSLERWEDDPFAF